MAPRALQPRTAQLLLAAGLLAVTVLTFTAVGALASCQGMCKDDSLVEYWTPAYAAFLAQMEPVKKWTCTWFQIVEWWTMGVQLFFWLSVCSAWKNGFLERHALPLSAQSAVATALCVFSALTLLDKGNYYVGKAYSLGSLAFWSFTLLSFFNGFLGLFICELNHTKQQGRASAGQGRLDRECDSDGGSGTSAGTLGKTVSVGIEP